MNAPENEGESGAAKKTWPLLRRVKIRNYKSIAACAVELHELNLSKMQVWARIDEVDVPVVKPGQQSRVYLQSDLDAPVPARVVRIPAVGRCRARVCAGKTRPQTGQLAGIIKCSPIFRLQSIGRCAIVPG